jgi:hypothetical protein
MAAAAFVSCFFSPLLRSSDWERRSCLQTSRLCGDIVQSHYSCERISLLPVRHDELPHPFPPSQQEEISRLQPLDIKPDRPAMS